MPRRLALLITLALGLAAPCAAGPADDVAAATKAWTDRFSSHDLEGLLALYDQASRDVGAGPVGAVNPDRAGAADVSFAAGHVRMVLDGIGLMGHSDHTPQETADLSTLPSQTKRAALLLHRIGQGAAGL